MQTMQWYEGSIFIVRLPPVKKLPEREALREKLSQSGFINRWVLRSPAWITSWSATTSDRPSNLYYHLKGAHRGAGAGRGSRPGRCFAASFTC
jgi:hypothetical protein